MLIWRNYGEHLALYTIGDEDLEEIIDLISAQRDIIGAKSKMHYIEPYTDFPDESYTFLLPAANEYDSWYTTISSIDFSEENPITSVVIDLVAKIQAILWKYEIDADIIDKDENRTAGIE